MTFTLRSHNVRHRMPGELAVPAVYADADAADVVVWQEVANRFGALTELSGERDLVGFLPALMPARALPILADPARFEVLGYGTFRLSEPARVGHAGAGRSPVLGAYAATYLTLRERTTRRTVSVVNWHGVASVQLEVRDTVSEEQVDNLAEGCKMLRRWGAVALVGDTNMRPGHENLEPLRRAGFWCANADGPATFGDRIIDHVWLWGDVKCLGVSVDKPTEKGEHRPLDVTLDLTGR